MQLDPLAQSASKEETKLRARLLVSTRSLCAVHTIDRPLTYAATCETLSVYDLTVPLFKAVSKGGVLYAMRKNMWNCLGQWARSQDAEDYDLTVNVGLDGRYCVRAGGRANETYA